jgi:8-hydroxy-5-deazaflavin:NADPH oxidoreductase
LKKHGKEVRIGSRSAEKLAQFAADAGIPTGTFADVAAAADIVILAVKGTAAEEALRLAGTEHLDGKIVIDTTNPIADAPPVDGVLQFFTGPGDSLMERLQKQVPGARFVKAFNSVGNAVMIDPKFPGGPPTMFFCGNDADAKRAVASLLKEIGWGPADMGSAVAAAGDRAALPAVVHTRLPRTTVDACIQAAPLRQGSRVAGLQGCRVQESID